MVTNGQRASVWEDPLTILREDHTGLPCPQQTVWRSLIKIHMSLLVIHDQTLGKHHCWEKNVRKLLVEVENTASGKPSYLFLSNLPIYHHPKIRPHSMINDRNTKTNDCCERTYREAMILMTWHQGY